MIIRPILVVTTLVLFVLKVTGAVGLSWLLVLSPLGSLALFMVLFVGIVHLIPPPDEDDE